MTCIEDEKVTRMATIPDRDLFEFLEHTADAAFTVTDAGEICSWNRSAETLLGFGRDEVIGKTCFDVFGGRGALGTLVCTEQCEVRDCAAQHRPIPDFDLHVRTRSGRHIWTNVSTMVHEDPKTGRRRVVHLMRSAVGRKRTDALVQRLLRTSKELLEAADDPVQSEPIARLSEQEHRVLRSLSEGQSPANIVRALKISPQTLRNHLHHINQKLGTHNRLEAVIHATRRKLI
jgi:PAS domain S-box-containing protein